MGGYEHLNLTTAQKDKHNIAMIQISEHGVLYHKGKVEEIKAMSGKRLVPNISQSHAVLKVHQVKYIHYTVIIESF